MCFINYRKTFDCVDHVKLCKVLREMGIPEHFFVLMRKLYSGQKATKQTEYGKTNQLQVGERE